MSATPDPVTAGAAYRAMMFELVGEANPADVQAATLQRLRDLVAGADDGLRKRPAAGEWSALELLGHIADAEIVMAGRYRWVLAQDTPEVIGYDQDLWVSHLGHNEADPEALLRLFGALRVANLGLGQRTPVAARARQALHNERGLESYEDMFRTIAGHDIFHLRQMEDTLRSVQQ